MITMGRLKGESHPCSKLTSEEVNEIRTLWDRGHRNIKVIAKNYDVSSTNIRKIIKGETWRHLYEWPRI